MNSKPPPVPAAVTAALEILEAHLQAFDAVVLFARKTDHPVPVDTRAWSQILVSVLTGIQGLKRQKGADLADGSDVKAASTWEAIDTPRFNGVIKAGTKSASSGKLASLDQMPYLFFVLWDHTPQSKYPRCRVWCVRTQVDKVFRAMCSAWYDKCETGQIISNNFQLHPPRGLNSDVFRNTCGNLVYPLLFCAENHGHGYTPTAYNPQVLKTGQCTPA